MQPRLLPFAVTIAILSTSPAQAQQKETEPAVAKPATAAAGPDDADAPASAAPTNPYKAFDDLSLKGWITPYPSIADTVVQDAGGVRSALADIGVGVFGLSINSAVANIGDKGAPGPERYNGHKSPTYNSSLQSVFVTYDLGRIGLKGGQLFGNVTNAANEWEAINGPRDIRIANLGYYQSFGDGVAELKVGIFDNNQEYIGVSVGGSLASGSLGPQARIPVQAGLSYSLFGTPAANLRLNFDKTKYVKFGVQRSTPPGGAAAELARNKHGLRFSVDGAKALYVGEAGYKRNVAPGVRSLWVRAGGLYNTTNYRDFVEGGTHDNWAIYAAVDAQVTQPDFKAPYRGLYLGASFNKATDRVNLYTNYYEARAYGIGLIPSRPSDLTSLVVTYNGLGTPARSVLSPTQPSDDHIITVIGSHSFRLTHGLYAQPGLGYVVHPVFAPKQPDAINLYFGLTMLL